MFLIAKILALPADLTVQLIGATCFACGIGTLPLVLAYLPMHNDGVDETRAAR